MLINNLIAPNPSEEVPSRLNKYCLKWANFRSYMKYGDGGILQQEFRTDQYCLYHQLMEFSQLTHVQHTSITHSILLNIALKGDIECYFPNSGTNHRLQQATFQIIIIPPGQTVQILPKGFSEVLQIKLSQSYIKNLLVEMPDLQERIFGFRYQNHLPDILPVCKFTMQQESEIRNELFSISDINQVKPKLRQTIFTLLSMCDYSLTCETNAHQATPIENAILSLIEEIKDAPNKNEHCTESMSKKCTVSEPTFIRYFKKITGRPVAEFVRESCMIKAKQLLQEHKYTLFEVSEIVGYTD